MPEKVLKKLNTCILPQWKVCFFSALLCGLIAHFYKITNWLPNWDSLVFRYDSQNMLALGRWFLPVVCSFSSFYDLPFLNGLVAIIFHALGGVCICRIFNIQKKVTAGFIGALLVSFPTVTSVFMYNYVADGYAISFFLSVLAVWYLTKEKPKFFLSVILIALSSGIYQAYLTVTIMLILLKLLDEVIFQQTSFTAILKKASVMLLAGVLGVALYGIVLKILLWIFSVELLDYQGVNATASLSNMNLLASLYVVKETFRKCFFDISGGVNVYVLLNGFVFLVTLGYYVKQIVTSRLYQNVANFVLILILTLLLPFGAGALAFINPGVDYHNLMLMGYSVFYLFFLLLYERGNEKNVTHSYVKCWIVFLTAILLISHQIVIANVSYHKAQIAYEKSYGVLLRIADRIEETPDTEQCTQVVVVGALEDSEAYSVNLTPDITGITDGYIIRRDDETVGQSVLVQSLNDYCGKDYDFVSGKEKEAFLKREEVQAMPQWPHKDSVAVVDGTIVIKLGM